MVAEMDNGTFTDSGFKVDAWTRMRARVVAVTKVDVTKQQLQSQHNTFKKLFKAFQVLLITSGFGYDDATKQVKAEPQVWAHYLMSHKDAMPIWKNDKRLPYHDELHAVFGDKPHATGRYATASTLTPPPAAAASGASPEEPDDEAQGASDAEDEEREPPATETPARGEVPAAKRLKRTSPADEGRQLLRQLVSQEPHAMQAMRQVSKFYGAQLTPLQTFRLKQHFSSVEAEARMFLTLTEEERKLFIDGFKQRCNA